MSDKFIVMADATCDLTEDIRKEYDIEVAPAHYTVPGMTEQTADLTWNAIGREEFYKGLGKNPKGYQTSPPNAHEFQQLFEKWTEKGYGILVLTISSAMSGTFAFAEAAKKAVLAKKADARICVVDSLRFGPGTGLLAIKASELRKEGKTLEEVAAYVEKTRLEVHQCGWLDDLGFVAKMGRINNAKAFFGTLAGIKSVGDLDVNGMTTILGNVKGEKSGFEALLKYIEKTIKDPAKATVIVAHTNREKQAQTFKALIEEKFKPAKILMTTVFPSCGISIGPGLMAAYYYGTPVSQGLAEEKKIFAEISEKK